MTDYARYRITQKSGTTEYELTWKRVEERLLGFNDTDVQWITALEIGESYLTTDGETFVSCYEGTEPAPLRTAHDEIPR